MQRNTDVKEFDPHVNEPEATASSQRLTWRHSSRSDGSHGRCWLLVEAERKNRHETPKTQRTSDSQAI